MKYYKSVLNQDRIGVYRKDENFYYLEGYSTRKNEWQQTSFNCMADLDRIFYPNSKYESVSIEITEKEALSLIMALELLK